MRKKQDEEFRKSLLNDRKVNAAMLMQYILCLVWRHNGDAIPVMMLTRNDNISSAFSPSTQL